MADACGSAPLESILVLEGISKALDDGSQLNAAYNAYLAQCEGAQSQPEPPAIWISRAANAEIAKVKSLLLKGQGEETAPKKRHVGAGNAETQP